MSFEYWYLFPISIGIATIAMSTGIGGAVFFSPIFLLGLKLAPPVAIGTALITEFFGFTSGLIAYMRQRLIDYRLAFQVCMFSVPAAIFGASIADNFPPEILKEIFAVGLLFIGVQIFIAWYGERQSSAEILHETASSQDDTAKHVVVDRTGRRFEYTVFNRPVAGIYAGVCGTFLGMISVGLAELMEFLMVAKCRIPAPVPVATSIFVVVVSVTAASVIHILKFIEAGPNAVDQVVSIAIFTAPGVLIGGQLGPILQKRLDPEHLKIFISIVFLAVGLFMLASMLVK